MTELYGIDISSYQEELDLSKVGLDFVIIKATGGTAYVNPACDKHFQQAVKLDIPRAFYHFAHEGYCKGSAIEEAHWFWDNTKNYFHDGIPILDFEADNKNDTAWAKEWLDEIYRLSGVKPLIYMSASTENAYDWSAVAAAGYGLWVSGYGVNQQRYGFKTSAEVPFFYHIRHWPFVAMWQYSSRTILPGYSADLDANQFYGDKAAWNAYAGKKEEPKPAPKPEPKPAPAPKPEPKPAPAPKPEPPKRAKNAVYYVTDAYKWLTAARRNMLYQAVKAICIVLVSYGFITGVHAANIEQIAQAALDNAPAILCWVTAFIAGKHVGIGRPQ